MLLQQAMFQPLSAAKNSTSQNFDSSTLAPTSPCSTSSTSSPMMDISPLERAFAEERERALAMAAAVAKGGPANLPFTPEMASAMASAAAAANAAAAASADHNGNNGNKNPAGFPFHPASLAAAFSLRPPVPISTMANSGVTSALNLTSSRPASDSEIEPRSPSEDSSKETDRNSSTSPSKEPGKSINNSKFMVDIEMTKF